MNARVWRCYLMLVTATAFSHLNVISFCSQLHWLGWTRRDGSLSCFSESPSIVIVQRTWSSTWYYFILTSIMSDNGPTPQDDADRVCTTEVWICNRHWTLTVPIDSFEEASKAAANCKRIIFFYFTVFPIFSKPASQANPPTLCCCHSTNTDRSISSPCSWSDKKENNSDKAWPCSLGTWIHR